MQPLHGPPPVDLFEQEEQIVKRQRESQMVCGSRTTIGTNCWMRHFVPRIGGLVSDK
jgi:hypothetical protein